MASTVENLSISKILISQPEPENSRSPYFAMAKKYELDIEFIPFVGIEGSTVKEVRKQRINLNDFNAVIFTSRNSMDHYFRLCDEMRVTVSQETKYFCVSEAIALNLQRHIQYRKRKVFYGNGTVTDLDNLLKKHKNTGKFLLPCLSVKSSHITDLTELSMSNYDMLVFFSPGGVESLFDNFPKFKQDKMIIAAFGATTIAKAEELGLTVAVKAPNDIHKSMPDAIIEFIKNKK